MREMLERMGYTPLEKDNLIFYSYDGEHKDEDYLASIVENTEAVNAILMPIDMIDDILNGRIRMVIRPTNIPSWCDRIFIANKESGCVFGELSISESLRLNTDTYEALREKHRSPKYFFDYDYASVYGWYISRPVRYCIPLQADIGKPSKVWAKDIRNSLTVFTQQEENPPVETPGEVNPPQIENQKKTEIFTVYVDGSFNPELGVYGSAAILINEDGEIVNTVSSFGSEYAEQRNVAGEIEAAILGIEMAQMKSIKKLHIVHDYEGIGAWADNRWKCNNPLTRQYVNLVTEARKTMSISFKWVRGHSGNIYNEKADQLAKTACGITESLVQQEENPYDFTESVCDAARRKGIQEACETSIRDFYSKAGHKFKDYLGIKSFGKDKYSEMFIEQLQSLISKEAAEVIMKDVKHTVDYASAMRWCLRGLRPQDASKKVNADREIMLKRGV